MPARPRKASKRRGDAAGQQRPSPEWGPVSDTVKRDARQFFAAAKRADRGSLTAGAWRKRCSARRLPRVTAQRMGQAQVQGRKRWQGSRFQGGAGGSAAGNLAEENLTPEEVASMLAESGSSFRALRWTTTPRRSSVVAHIQSDPGRRANAVPGSNHRRCCSHG